MAPHYGNVVKAFIFAGLANQVWQTYFIQNISFRRFDFDHIQFLLSQVNSVLLGVSSQLKSTETRMFVQQYVYANKENTKGPHYWHFVTGIHWWPADFHTKDRSCISA